jgi:hypothetical protein
LVSKLFEVLIQNLEIFAFEHGLTQLFRLLVALRHAHTERVEPRRQAAPPPFSVRVPRHSAVSRGPRTIIWHPPPEQAASGTRSLARGLPASVEPGPYRAVCWSVAYAGSARVGPLLPRLSLQGEASRFLLPHLPSIQRSPRPTRARACSTEPPLPPRARPSASSCHRPAPRASPLGSSRAPPVLKWSSFATPLAGFRAEASAPSRLCHRRSPASSPANPPPPLNSW